MGRVGLGWFGLGWIIGFGYDGLQLIRIRSERISSVGLMLRQ